MFGPFQCEPLLAHLSQENIALGIHGSLKFDTTNRERLVNSMKRLAMYMFLSLILR